MKSLKLHVGCASIRLPGYLNIDCRKTDATDYVCPASAISAVSVGTVDEIYSRHMLEHLDFNEAKLTLLHWYDLLAPNAFINIIVPDIKFHAKQVLGLANSHFDDQMEHAYAGFWGWCDEFRGGSNEDAHRWGYTEESLQKLLLGLGFVNVKRCLSGIDTEPWHLNFLAYKPAVDYKYNDNHVSVVIPAYKSDYFELTLDSVFNQNYNSLDVIINDDSSSDDIFNIVERKRLSADFPIRYFKNERRLGEVISTVRGIRLAKGKYIKFLHDDDILEPDCIAELVSAIEGAPNIALASSRRCRVDEQANLLPDIMATCFPFSESVVIDGKQLVSFLADHTINFIGEPSCVLARRIDLLKIADQLMSLNGKLIHWVGDLALYAKILQRGNLAFVAKTLTKFRVSTQQFSQIGRDQPGVGEQGHADFRQAIRDLGWYVEQGSNHLVDVAALVGIGSAKFRPLNILENLRECFLNTTHEASVEKWMLSRCLTPVQNLIIEQYISKLNRSVSLAVLVLESTLPSAVTPLAIESLNKVRFKPNIVIKKISTGTLPAPEKINSLLEELETDWFVIVNASDEFTASGLLIAQLELGQSTHARAVYFDEIYRDSQGKLGAALRPAFNLDYLLSFPTAMTKHWLLNRQSVLDIGGFAADLPDAIEFDLLLRLVNESGGNDFIHIAEPLLITAAPVLVNVEDERQAIVRHLQARGYPKANIQAPQSGRYHVQYEHENTPVVSVILLAADHLASLQRCVEGLLANTDYQNFEILLLESQPQATDVHDWLQLLEGMGETKLRVISQQKKHSSAFLLNIAAKQAIGDYLLLLSPNTAVLDKDWLSNLLNHAQRGEVGAVGAKLLTPDGKIAQAIQVLGLQGPLGNPFVGERFDEPGYMQRLQVDQNVSSLSSDCLIIPRELYLQAGGLDEAFPDVYMVTDLCLKLREAGYFLVWTPSAQLMLDQLSIAQSVDSQEDCMYEKWLPQLARDPAYNSNFSLAMPGGFKLADSQISWRPLKSVKSVPVALVHPADLSGCGHYRVIQPILAMKEAGLSDGVISTGLMHVTDLERYNPDTIILQRQIGDERLRAMRRMQSFSRAFKVYELDDYLPNLPLKSVHRAAMPKDILKSLRQGLSFVDRFVVSTEPLAEALLGFHREVVVVENCLPVHWWQDLQTQRRQGKKPRVGWAGGASHTGDLELIADIVRDLADEVEWVFFGMCPPAIRPYVHEFYEGVSIEQYPAQLAALNLDLGLAPLEINLFNECKSNLRQLEYGACGIPVICTDIRPFQSGLPVTLVRNRYKEWVDAIRAHINDLDATEKLGNELQARVHADWMLEGDNLRRWHDAWFHS